MRWNNRRTLLLVGICCCAAISCGPSGGFADPPAGDPAAPPAAAEPKSPSDSKPPAETKPAADPKAAEPKADAATDPDVKFLTPTNDLWINKKKHQVGFTGKVARREGLLEMLACPGGGSEYESIIGTTIKRAFPIHAALLAAGAEPGHPAWYDNKTQEFHAAKGAEIEVLIRWTDAKGKKHEDRGQDWIRDKKTGKAVDSAWLFAGSILRVDPDTGEKSYNADGGHMICVVNHPDAMMDLASKSPTSWDDHILEPFTDNIPPKGTEVEIVLTPKLDKKGATDKANSDKEKAETNKPGTTPAPAPSAPAPPPAAK